MKKSISILGAGGKMGTWFVKFFLANGYQVIGYDIENEIKDKAVIKAESLVGAILKADYVMLCTPTRRTPEIIRLIAKEMKRESYLIEISSQKSKTAASLSKMPAKVNPLCIHPMFGPGTKKIIGQHIISIPIKDAKKELSVAKSLFPGANFVTIDVIEHDKKIAVILGLTHLINVVFANILAKDDKITLTEKMSGTTFKAQKILTESIMTESPELIETIISNPEIRRFAEEFWRDFGRLLTSVQEGKSEEVIDYIKSSQERLAKTSDLENAHKKLTIMVNSIEKKP
ncbi:MAG: Prephenate dehydrogenase [Nitrosopumilales archaeon]|nr:MAG: Prephenate dehydrogenase [Nitrosopumilales archaeon]